MRGSGLVLLLLVGCGPALTAPSDGGAPVLDADRPDNDAEVALQDATNVASLPDAAVVADATRPDEGDVGSNQRGVHLQGNRLLVDGAPFEIRGVCWNPVGRGGTHPADLDYRGFVDSDAALMATAGINVVRTYSTIMDRDVLDRLYAAGIYVLNSVYVWGQDEPSVVTERVAAVADHPAILMWVIGNEWNYNGLYVGLSFEASLARVAEAAAFVRAADPHHPIATVYGELPSEETIAALDDIDVWGINAYRGISFYDLFDVWSARSSKPMFLAEYGADAYNANISAPDPMSQARATTALTEEILDHSSARFQNGTCLGGTIFEWADEWWKDGAGRPDEHDIGGIAPGGGPYPDRTFNEEWWGVVEVDRTPRPAFEALRRLYAP